MREAAFDRDFIREQWGSCQDPLFREVLAVFQGEVEELREALRRAMLSQQRTPLLAAAHTLRGAAGNVGALWLAGRAAAAETGALRAPLPTLQAILTDIDLALADVAQEISKGGPFDR